VTDPDVVVAGAGFARLYAVHASCSYSHSFSAQLEQEWS
jgi:hypothetical protein